MHLSGLDYLALGAAAVGSGAINALAGGGTLITFPALVAVGVGAVPANVTNTVSLLPGYLAGSWAQRRDLAPQIRTARLLVAVSALGGLVGSVLLLVIPAQGFRASVPYLILLASALLAFGDRLRTLLGTAPDPVGPNPAGPDAAAAAEGLSGPAPAGHPAALVGSVLVSSAYGGFFGAGLGIILLAVLGLFSGDPLSKVNALKQALSFVVNLVAAAFFVLSGRVAWAVVPVMAVGSLAGGFVGGRLAQVVPQRPLRAAVVAGGVAVAIAFWVQ